MRIQDIKFDRVELTSQGFLVADANLTRTGVFDYYGENGQLIRELRAPEEVFSKESMDSLKFAPLTKHHPDEMITPDNVKKFQIGMVGENIEKRGDFVRGKIVITDKKEIADILKKRDEGKPIELSMGYDAELVDLTGTHIKDGEFQKTQKNIRYNHASVVDKGRAGREVKIIMDAEAEAVELLKPLNKKIEDNAKEVKVMKFLKKGVEIGAFRMDAIEGDIGEDSKGVVDRLSDKLDEALVVIQTHVDGATATVKEKEELQAKYDQLEEDAKKAKTDLEGLTNPSSPTIQRMIQERTDLETVAGTLKVEVAKEDGAKKSNKEIKIDCIVALSPDFKADEKSDDYIGARFDAVVEAIESKKGEKTPNSLGSFLKDAKEQQGKEEKNPAETFKDASDKMWKKEAA